MHGTRTQAERDAVTVEIGFALLSAAVLAGLVLLAFFGAHAVLDLPETRTWLTLGKGTAAVVFAGRVVQVLLRSRAGRRPGPEHGRAAHGQAARGQAMDERAGGGGE